MELDNVEPLGGQLSHKLMERTESILSGDEDEFLVQDSEHFHQENLDLWNKFDTSNGDLTQEVVKPVSQWITPEAPSFKPKRLSALDKVSKDNEQDSVQNLRRVHVTLQEEHDFLRKRLGLTPGAVVEVSAVVSGPEKDAPSTEHEGPEVFHEVPLSPSTNGYGGKRASILLPPTAGFQSSGQPRRTSGHGKNRVSTGNAEKKRTSTGNAERTSVKSDSGSFNPQRISGHRMSLMLTGPSGEGFAPVLPHQFDHEGENSCTLSDADYDPTNSRCSLGSHVSNKSRKSQKDWRGSCHSNRSSIETLGPCVDTRMSNRSNRSGFSATSRKSYKNLFAEKALTAHACWTSDCDDDLHRRIRLFQGGEELPERNRMSKRFSGNEWSGKDSITRGPRPSIRSVLEGMGVAIPIVKKTSSQRQPRREPIRRLIRHLARCDGRAMDPSSPLRMCWNVVSMVLLIYDLVFIPLQIFDMPTTILAIVMRWFSVGFWTCDIFASFMVGFLREGVAELRMREVCWRYLRTWFAFDVALVAADVANAAITDLTGSMHEQGTFSRIRDVLCAMRLLRMLKLPKIASQVHVHIQSQLSMVVLGIAKMMAMILAMNHFVACVWYGISRWNNGNDTWLRQKSTELTDSSVLYFYTLSLHWSLTQFTPATMEVHPENILERIFAIIVIYTALITFSSFVSSITNAMTHLRHLNKEKNTQYEHLQRYLHGNHISLSLRVRVRRHLDHLFSQREQFVNEKEVAFLPLLSIPLRVELRYEVFAPVLRVHGFFHRYEELFQGAMQKICYTAVDQLCLSLGDKLFSLGEKASKMYFIRSGMFEYQHHGGKTALISEGQWLTEIPLWAAWVHSGTATAIDESTLVTLDAAKFQDVVVHNRAALIGPSHYACLVVEYLNSCDLQDLSDVVDPEFNLDRALLVSFADLWETDSCASAFSPTPSDSAFS